MTVLIVVFIVLLVLFTWLLLVPIQIIVDSRESYFMVRIVSVGSAAIYVHDKIPVLQLKGFFLTKDIYLNSLGSKSPKPEKHKKKKKKKKKKRFSRKRMKWILRLFRLPVSFRFTTINLNIDSGDPIVNAYMYPVFGQLHNLRPGWNWSINYFGEIKIYLVLQSSLIRMIYVYFK